MSSIQQQLKPFCSMPFIPMPSQPVVWSRVFDTPIDSSGRPLIGANISVNTLSLEGLTDIVHSANYLPHLGNQCVLAVNVISVGRPGHERPFALELALWFRREECPIYKVQVPIRLTHWIECEAWTSPINPSEIDNPAAVYQSWATPQQRDSAIHEHLLTEMSRVGMSDDEIADQLDRFLSVLDSVKSNITTTLVFANQLTVTLFRQLLSKFQLFDPVVYKVSSHTHDEQRRAEPTFMAALLYDATTSHDYHSTAVPALRLVDLELQLLNSINRWFEQRGLSFRPPHNLVDEEGKPIEGLYNTAELIMRAAICIDRVNAMTQPSLSAEFRQQNPMHTKAHDSVMEEVRAVVERLQALDAPTPDANA